MAYISVLSTTESSIRVQMRGLDTTYERADRRSEEHTSELQSQR